MIQKGPIDHQTFAVIDAVKSFAMNISKKRIFKNVLLLVISGSTRKSSKYFNGLTLFVQTPWLWAIPLNLQRLKLSWTFWVQLYSTDDYRLVNRYYNITYLTIIEDTLKKPISCLPYPNLLNRKAIVCKKWVSIAQGKCSCFSKCCPGFESRSWYFQFFWHWLFERSVRQEKQLNSIKAQK